LQQRPRATGITIITDTTIIDPTIAVVAAVVAVVVLNATVLSRSDHTKAKVMVKLTIPTPTQVTATAAPIIKTPGRPLIKAKETLVASSHRSRQSTRTPKDLASPSISPRMWQQ
jgi:hypothetical protein